MTKAKRSGSGGSAGKIFPHQYFYAAADFAAAADAYVSAYGSRADSHVTYFLLAKSFELAVKAVLLAHGVSRRRVRNLQHDLVAGVRLARRLNIEIVDPTISDTAWGIQALTAAYASTELAYRERGSFSVPNASLLRKLLHFALERAACDALRPEARKRLLAASPARPGLTLDDIGSYK